MSNKSTGPRQPAPPTVLTAQEAVARLAALAAENARLRVELATADQQVAEWRRALEWVESKIAADPAPPPQESAIRLIAWRILVDDMTHLAGKYGYLSEETAAPLIQALRDAISEIARLRAGIADLPISHDERCTMLTAWHTPPADRRCTCAAATLMQAIDALLAETDAGA